MSTEIFYSSFKEFCNGATTNAGFKDISPYDKVLVRQMNFICRSFDVRTISFVVLF